MRVDWLKARGTESLTVPAEIRELNWLKGQNKYNCTAKFGLIKVQNPRHGEPQGNKTRDAEDGRRGGIVLHYRTSKEYTNGQR